MVEATLRAGADMIGLVSFAKSPRHVTLDEGAELVALMRGRTQSVALLVNPSDAELTQVLARWRPDWVQLHGDESVARCAQIKNTHNVQVMKALPIATADDVAAALAYQGVVDRLLFDAKPLPDALPGGNGLSFDWRLLLERPPNTPYMLSGGLTPHTVAQAIAMTSCAGVDVSSGVESAVGVKDAQLIATFVANARAAFAV